MIRFPLLAATCLVSLLSWIATSDAFAEAGDYSRSGLYAGVGATWLTDLFEDNVADFASDLAGTPVKVDIADTWGLHGVVGYRVAPILAIEAQYEYVDEFAIDATAAGISGRVQLEGNVLTGNLKLILPTWRVQPYVLVGAGIVWYSVKGGISGIGQQLFKDDEAFAGRVGLGADLYLTESWLLNIGASAVLSTEKVSSNIGAADLKGLHYIGGGATLQYRF